MRCAECDRLRVALLEAKQELEAWQAYAADDDPAGPDLDRLARWRSRLKSPDQVAAVIMMLADARGRVVTKLQIVDALRHHPGARVDEPNDKLGTVLVSKARAVLERFALTTAISTHWGLGWSMDDSARRQVLGFVGERA